MKRYLQILALLFVAFALQPNAQATSTAIVVDQKVCTGTAASGGGTMTCDYTTTTDRASWLIARAALTSKDAGSHLSNAALLFCEYVVENKNGTVSAATALASSNNPANDSTTTFVASHAQAADAAFIGAGAPTCVYSISGTAARLTVTNPGGTAADVTVWVQAFNFGSQ